jgi:hypothetical protein
MEQERRRVLREVLARVSPGVVRRRYRPERHYMRGPGPKTLSKIGELLREEVEADTREPIPQRWLDLIQAMERKERSAG